MSGHIDEIVDAIDRLTAVSQTSINLPYFLTFVLNVFPVLLGALAGYWLSNKQWKKAESKKDLVGSVRELDFLLKEIEEKAVEFWCRGSNVNVVEDSIVHSTLASNIAMSDQLVEHLLSNEVLKLDTSVVSKLTIYKDDIYELATGEEFESISRKVDKVRATKISKRCVEIRAKLAKYK